MSDATADTAQDHAATSPIKMTWPAWKAVLGRTWAESGRDNISLVSAGVAFYAFLALVPLLGAIVLSYGLVAEPATVIKDMQGLTGVMPGDSAKLIGEQLMNVVKTSSEKKGWGLLLALALALYGARNGASATVTALNIAYEEEETRGFFKLNLIALAITACGVIMAILATVAIAALGHLETFLPWLPDAALVIGKLISYLFLLLAAAAGAATLYRYAPDRRAAKWTWLTPGSLGAALLWLLLTLAFGLYVADFGNYNATYGSLGAVVVLLTWLYLSAYVLLMGAELNAECEHQTSDDTTRGRGKPLGQRGAWVADHVAKGQRPHHERGTSISDASGKDPADKDVSVSPPATKAQAPSTISTYAAMRGAQGAGRAVGLGRAAFAPTLGAAIGMTLLRKRHLAGVVALGLSGAAAWLGGRRPEK